MSAAQTLDREVAQSLITKLDLGRIRPKDAKEFAAKYYGVQLSGRTREQVAKSIGQCMAAPAQPEVTLTEAETLVVIADRRDQRPAATGLRLQETIGTGSHLFAVCVKGDDWDGSAQWLARGDHFKDALATALAQYDDLPEDQRPDSWDGIMVGEFV